MEPSTKKVSDAVKFSLLQQHTQVQDNFEETFEKDGEVSEEDEIPKWMFWKRRRYIVVLLAFFGFFSTYCLRVNLSVAIVPMTANRSIVLENNKTIYEKEFAWDSKLQGYILSSFFYGYITTQVGGGILSARIGGNKVFGWSIALTALLTLLTPWLAKTNLYLLIGVRILEGICEGVTYPCIHGVWAKWAPPLERSRMTTLAFCGSYVGTVFTMPVCAYLAEAFGWPSIFYSFGVLSLLWVATWMSVVSTSPQEDKRISKTELFYIKSSLKYAESNGKVVYPWKKIFTSMPVYAIIIAHFSENWGFYSMIIQLPKFLKDVLDFSLETTGLMAALPYLIMSLTTIFAGYLADWLQVKGYLTTTQVRKVFNCGAMLCQCFLMIGVVYSLSPLVTMTCLICSVGLDSFAWTGFSVNYLDVAPQHASLLMGIGNTIGTLPGIISPIITGYIVTTPTASEWQIVFCISSGIYLFGCIFYGIFASGELQSWAKTANEEDVELHNIKGQCFANNES